MVYYFMLGTLKEEVFKMSRSIKKTAIEKPKKTKKCKCDKTNCKCESNISPKTKKNFRKQVRAKAKVSEDGIEMAKKCTPSKKNIRKRITNETCEKEAASKSQGYSAKRVAHKKYAK